MNELFHTLQGLRGGRLSEAPPKPVDLDWRGKSVRLLTPDEVVAFANEMFRQRDCLRRERDQYLDRALAAEAELSPERRSDYDTTHERDMDMGSGIDRLVGDYR
jgi:hypothetical protein